MKRDCHRYRRVLWFLWLAALILFIGIALYPISSGLTRAGGAALFLALWLGLIGLFWRRRALRFLLLGFTVLSTGFLCLPARNPPDIATLRNDDVAALGRYEGVAYVWGGESPLGIDCSGLMRRGLIDSLFCRGFLNLDPGLVRRSIWIWWHDATASDLGLERMGVTIHLFDAPSVNALDATQILPGDLVVVGNGIHIMAYLGNNVWIEADPNAKRVIRVTAPSPDSHWFSTRAMIMRWAALNR